MKIKYLLLLLTGLIICMMVNSCKKESQTAIQTLFTGGTWQLTSVQDSSFTGNSLISTTVLDTACVLAQFFTFNADKTCTYTNFDCIQQTPPGGQWALTSNQLILQSNVVCKDTTSIGSSMPFANAKILNLGQYSLVLETGDIQPNFSLTAKRKTRRFGFVRIKSP
jgi:hypothetical protein